MSSRPPGRAVVPLSEDAARPSVANPAEDATDPLSGAVPREELNDGRAVGLRAASPSGKNALAAAFAVFDSVLDSLAPLAEAIPLRRSMAMALLAAASVVWVGRVGRGRQRPSPVRRVSTDCRLDSSMHRGHFRFL